MGSKITLVDAKNLNNVVWPTSEQAALARSFLVPIIESGTQAFIKNLETELYLLIIDDQVIPITVNQKEYNNAYVVSNYFAIKYWKEQLATKGVVKKMIQKPLANLAGSIMKGMKINKLILVNNWLFPTNIHPILTRAQVEEITQFLKDRFGDHLITFRGLNIHHHQDLLARLKRTRYRLMKTRTVHIYDPDNRENLPSKVLRSHRRDERLIASCGYEVIRTQDLTKEDISRMLELYKGVYLDKYTSYSPQYCEKYLAHILDKKLMNFVGLRKDGKIDGIFGCFKIGKEMIVPFFGYEKSEEMSAKMYRMLATLIVKEAEAQNLVLNNSSGASGPKKNRGHTPALEYTAIFDDHLPTYRRYFWGLSATIMNTFVSSTIN